MDYASLLYDPNYSIFGVAAVLTMDCGEPPMTITAIDKTSGIIVGGTTDNGSRAFGGSVDVQTILPAAVVRAAELADIDLANLEDASLELNGKTWTVKSYMLKPSPKGEGDGEVFLILEAA